MAKKSERKSKAEKQPAKTGKKIIGPKAVCPACGIDIALESCTIGQVIECPDCGAELEVVKKGLKLDVEYIEHEDQKDEVEAPEYDESD